MLQLGGNGGMGMLKSITLENYKCFKDKIDIDIAPLTVLCGVNSSGKSSILKSLLMMKQTVEKESPYNKLSFIGNYVDNGYWEDIINIDSLNNDEAIFSIKNTFVLKNFDPNQNRQDIPAYKEIRKLYSFIRSADSFELTHELSIKKFMPNNSSNPFEEFIGNNNVICSKISIIVKDCQGIEIPKYSGYVSIDKIGNTERTYALNYSNIPYNKTINSILKPDYKCYCYFSNIKLTNFYRESIMQDVLQAKPTILSLFNIASMQYSGINFIAPLRQHPMRNYIIKGDVNNVGISGEDTPILFAKYQDDKHMRDIPSPLKGSDNVYRINFIPDSTKGISLKEHVQKWMNYFELGKIETIGNSGLLSLNINGHNIADVGFGVSQILPIIVQGLHMQKDSTLLLEQPEIHLHPKMQMRMADFLLALASTERDVVVETHSDHIINRLVKRIMSDKTGKLNNTVKIYFIDKNAQNPIERISIAPTKGIINAPMNFFTQFATETMDIAQIGFNNHKEGVEWERSE